MYVYVREDAGTPGEPADDTWALQAQLFASEVAAEDHFGETVAIDGDTLVVGGSLTARQPYTGAVHVYHRIGSTWTLEQVLLAGDGAPFDGFGAALAVDGDTIVIGARGDDDNGASSGSAYVFVRSGGTWMQQVKLVPGDGAELDTFGASVDVDGDSVIVGAGGDDDAGSAAGSAYVFVRSGTAWSEQQKLSASDAAPFDSFGSRVAIDADTAVVAAGGDDDRGSASGSAYVFVREEGLWAQQQKLVPRDGMTNHRFGGAVALDGDTTLIGAIGDDDLGTFSGAAYVFRRTGSHWGESVKLGASDGGAHDLLIASDGALGDAFGWGLALSGDASTAVIGAFSAEGGGAASNAGAAYLFRLLRYVAPTPSGSGVAVQPADPETNEVLATITFSQVTADGTTTLMTSETGPGVPSGFQLGDPATYYDITTTASVSGSIEVCIDYSGVSFDEAATLKLLHFEDGAWVDTTTSIDTANQIICGSVTSLSPFAIVDTHEAADPVVLLLELVDLVAELNAQRGIQNGLDAKLDAALEALLDGSLKNDAAAIGALEAFVNAVEAQSGNQITAEDANMLTDFAENTIAVLELAG